MKIRVAFLPSETELAMKTVDELKKILDHPKIRTSDRHPPYLHVFLTVKEPYDKSTTLTKTVHGCK